MLKKIGETLFRELFQSVIDNFERRISELEKENHLLKSNVRDNKEYIKEIQNELKGTLKTTSKVEATIQTMLLLSRGKLENSTIKQIGDGNER